MEHALSWILIVRAVGVPPQSLGSRQLVQEG